MNLRCLFYRHITSVGDYGLEGNVINLRVSRVVLPVAGSPDD